MGTKKEKKGDDRARGLLTREREKVQVHKDKVGH